MLADVDQWRKKPWDKSIKGCDTSHHLCVDEKFSPKYCLSVDLQTNKKNSLLADKGSCPAKCCDMTSSQQPRKLGSHQRPKSSSRKLDACTAITAMMRSLC
ncbi:unnamed protein product [Ixodes pacificus]